MSEQYDEQIDLTDEPLDGAPEPTEDDLVEDESIDLSLDEADLADEIDEIDVADDVETVEDADADVPAVEDDVAEATEGAAEGTEPADVDLDDDPLEAEVADLGEPADDVVEAEGDLADEAAADAGRGDRRRLSEGEADAASRRGRGPARGLPPRAVGQAGRLVRRAHLLRHGEPGEVEPREPHRLPQHGGLHPRDRGPHRGHRGDQERPAPHAQEARPCRATCWCAWTSPTSRGRPCATRRRSPGSSATATSPCR